MWILFSCTVYTHRRISQHGNVFLTHWVHSCGLLLGHMDGQTDGKHMVEKQKVWPNAVKTITLLNCIWYFLKALSGINTLSRWHPCLMCWSGHFGVGNHVEYLKGNPLLSNLVTIMTIANANTRYNWTEVAAERSLCVGWQPGTSFNSVSLYWYKNNSLGFRFLKGIEIISSWFLKGIEIISSWFLKIILDHIELI